jgi:bla regulator protein BlaR1
MLSHWFLYAIVMTALIAAAATVAEHLAAVWRMPRRGIWALALGAAIVAPAAAGVRVQPRAATRVSSPSRAAVGTPTVVYRSLAIPATVSPAGVSTRTPAYRTALSAIDPLLTPLWFAASATLVVFFLAAMLRLRRQARAWNEARLDGVAILVAPEAGPAVVGFVRPRVVVPEWIMSLDARARALILRHELEHVRARDPYLLLFAIVSTVALPWNLALWFVARRLTLAMELDCDQRVLQTTDSAREYGLMLLEIARRRNIGGPVLGASLVQPRRFLARRIQTMVASRPRRPRLVSLGLAAAAALLTVAATRLPMPEPLRLSGPAPRISATWENAPIELVVGAFAQFSGRKIGLASDVTGSVTARVTDEPWDEALAHIMATHGYRVVVHADSSITIEVARSSIRRSMDRSSATQYSTSNPLARVTDQDALYPQ